MENELREAKYLAERLKKERIRARKDFAEASKSLERANQFKDSAVGENGVQKFLDAFIDASNRLKANEKEYEAILEKIEKIEKAIKKKKQKSKKGDGKVLTSPDDKDFWKISI